MSWPSLKRECSLFYNSQRRVNFDNTLVVIVRSEFKDDILLDGQRLTTWNAYWGYSIASMPVSHDQHLIQVVSGSAATFAAYIYGHSILDTSSSAYGFTVTFKGRSPLNLVQSDPLRYFLCRLLFHWCLLSHFLAVSLDRHRGSLTSWQSSPTAHDQPAHQSSSKTTTHLALCNQLINCYCLYHGCH